MTAFKNSVKSISHGLLLVTRNTSGFKNILCHLTQLSVKKKNTFIWKTSREINKKVKLSMQLKRWFDEIVARKPNDSKIPQRITHHNVEIIYHEIISKREKVQWALVSTVPTL